MKRVAIAAFGLLAACGGRLAREGEDGGLSSLSAIDSGSADANLDAGDAAQPAVPVNVDAAVDDADAGPDPCAEAGVPPSTLECAGLYADFATQTISPTARAYAPAVPLWSDGAAKQRWIELPPGQPIDVSNPSEWTFPVGTKLFKQFTVEGRRVETRLFQKTAANTWVRATYAWNADQTATMISYGETVPVDTDGGNWVIPTPQDCDSCHGGRLDRILGFEQVSLGLAGATGLTLLQLVAEGLVTPAPTQVNLTIGDDGTGLAAPALSWLHINCGVTCHNSNENAQAYGAKMVLRLDPTLLNGSAATSAWQPLGTTMGVPCVSGSVAGEPRISPADPSASAIVQLISMRGVLQMPPIASRVVDLADVANVVSWIQHMPSSAPGLQDAGLDSGSAGEVLEAGGVQDAGGAEVTVGDGRAVSDGQAAPDATLMVESADGGALADGQAAPDATLMVESADGGVSDTQGATNDGALE